mmetsp:Transcript_29137/g.73243  ORF Transcript_29137/g.73243 Transcript_29137/m.73243 type:complete len:176 (-) Transcript_29137:1585-2112(-)
MSQAHNELDFVEPASGRFLAARAADLLDEDHGVVAPKLPVVVAEQAEELPPKDARELNGAWTVKATLFPCEMLPGGSTDFYTGQLAEGDAHAVSGTADFTDFLGTAHHGTLQGERQGDSVTLSVIWTDEALSQCQLDWNAEEASKRGNAFFSGLFMTTWSDGTEMNGLMELYPKE